MFSGGWVLFHFSEAVASTMSVAVTELDDINRCAFQLHNMYFFFLSGFTSFVLEGNLLKQSILLQ